MKLLRGVDMDGRVCGESKGVENATFAVWPHPLHYEPKICVATCNYTHDPKSKRMAQLYVSTPYLHYCVPQLVSSNSSVSLNINLDSQFGDSFSQGSEIASRAVADIFAIKEWVFGSSVSCIVVVFTWIFLLKCFAGHIVFISFVSILVIMLYGAVSVYSWAQKEKAIDAKKAQYAEIAAGVLLGIGFLWLCVIFFLRKQIAIAVEVVKEASTALMDMKALLLFPLYPVIIGVGYIVLWVYIGLYTWSVTTLTPKPTPTAVMNYDPIFFPLKVILGEDMRNDNPEVMQRATRNDQWRNASFYHLFHLLWTVQFLIYFGYLVFAGATADWYFSKHENGKKVRGNEEGALTNWPLCAAFKRTICWHLGTIALCSLIIAIVQMMRVIAKYVEKQTQGNPPNKLQKALFAAIQCCLGLLECCLDKLNRNALIWTAIWGDGFCTAACSAFALLWRNLHRVAAINVVSTILLNISKFAICLINAGLLWGIILYSTLKDEVSSPAGPCTVVFVISWLIASCFMNVFAAIIDAIFLCFLVDLETNKHGEMMGSKTLQELVGKYAGESEKKAKKEADAANRRGGATKVEPNEPADQEMKGAKDKKLDTPVGKKGAWT